MHQAQHIIFDFDGTLVDSAPAILAGFAAVLTAHGITPQLPLDEGLIGPPLQETLALLSGIKDKQKLTQLAEDFKRHYDSDGVLVTPAYRGVTSMLDDLRRSNRILHIATNKRIAPTRSIVAHLGWTETFDSLYALDIYSPRLADKSALLACLLHERKLAAAHCIYVGDKFEDGEAADGNQLPFIAAQWGYGDFEQDECPQHWQFAESPNVLKTILLG